LPKASDLAHFAAGFTAAVLVFVNPVLSVLMTLTYLAYEAAQEVYSPSGGIIGDLLEFMIGLASGSAVCAYAWFAKLVF